MEKLKIAIQKSGRLYEDCIKLLKECDISVIKGENQLKTMAKNFPLEVMFLRNSDIPSYVEDGVVDIGIIGENTFFEKDPEIEIIRKLGFSKCRLSLAVPKNTEYSGVEFFEGKKIATSYPNSIKKFLKEKGVSADLHFISGSVEIAPSIGLADGVCDLVSSGNTLFMNGLKECEVILKSEAILVANKNLSGDKKILLDSLLFRINSVKEAKGNKYLILNAPNENLKEIVKLVPGMNSPSIFPLKNEGWSAVHSVIRTEDFWNNIDELKSAGAEGILIIPIEKMIN